MGAPEGQDFAAEWQTKQHPQMHRDARQSYTPPVNENLAQNCMPAQGRVARTQPTQAEKERYWWELEQERKREEEEKRDREWKQINPTIDEFREDNPNCFGLRENNNSYLGTRNSQHSIMWYRVEYHETTNNFHVCLSDAFTSSHLDALAKEQEAPEAEVSSAALYEEDSENYEIDTYLDRNPDAERVTLGYLDYVREIDPETGEPQFRLIQRHTYTGFGKYERYIHEYVDKEVEEESSDLEEEYQRDLEVDLDSDELEEERTPHLSSFLASNGSVQIEQIHSTTNEDYIRFRGIGGVFQWHRIFVDEAGDKRVSEPILPIYTLPMDIDLALNLGEIDSALTYMSHLDQHVDHYSRNPFEGHKQWRERQCVYKPDFLKGRILFQQGSYDLALDYFGYAASSAKKLGDPSLTHELTVAKVDTLRHLNPSSSDIGAELGGLLNFYKSPDRSKIGADQIAETIIKFAKPISQNGLAGEARMVLGLLLSTDSPAVRLAWAKLSCSDSASPAEMAPHYERTLRKHLESSTDDSARYLAILCDYADSSKKIPTKVLKILSEGFLGHKIPDSSGVPAELSAKVLCVKAEALARLGRRDEAIELLDQVGERFNELGAKRLEDECLSVAHNLPRPSGRIRYTPSDGFVDNVRLNDVRRVKRELTEVIDLYHNERGAQALAWAASNGNLELVQLLVEKGADINSQRRDYPFLKTLEKPLPQNYSYPLLAVRDKQRTDVIAYLLKCGADNGTLVKEGESFL